MAGNGLSLLLVCAAGAMLAFGGATVGGLPIGEAVALLLYAAGALALTAWAVDRARPSLRDGVGAVLMWGVFIATLTAIYVKREDAMDGLRSVAQEVGINASPTIVASPGEVTIIRRGDGSFRVPASINDRPASFIFDTGASTVVLTHEVAHDLGLKPETLRFRIPVLTANGRTLAAPVTLDRLAIGPIVLHRVPALVAGPALLHENLLGGSVLDRLESYEVRGNRLVLRAGKG